MNLREIRQWVIQQSGRYNLVTSVAANTDNGVDKYIQAGQRWLDRQFSFGGEEAELSVSVATGDYTFNVQGLRAIRDVYVQDPNTQTFAFLSRQTRRDLHEYYGDLAPSLASVDPGVPAYFVPGIERTGLAGGTSAYMVVFAPPADRTYTLVVRGLLGTRLSGNTSTSWWSVNHPDVLVNAACYMLERAFRNTQGANDYRAQLEEDLQGIDADQVEEESASADQILDSWAYIKSPRRLRDI